MKNFVCGLDIVPRAPLVVSSESTPAVLQTIV